jgi:plasmid stability protein
MKESKKIQFNIREVDEDVRRKVRLYAADKGITMAQAIREIVEKGTKK